MERKYLTTEEAAEIIKRKPSTLKVWRAQPGNKGPVFFKDKGGKVWYTEQAITDFIEGNNEKIK